MIEKTLVNLLEDFRDARDWKQFHTPENLAKAISIEASELLECFQWNSGTDAAGRLINRDQVLEELADVLTYCYFMASIIGVDPEQIIRNKLELTNEKYPVEKAKGTSAKYTQF